MKNSANINVKEIRYPAKTCLFCDKKIEDIGGFRIVADSSIGIFLTDRKILNDNKKTYYCSIQLFNDSGVYMIIRGDKAKWKIPVIEKAKILFLTGYHPWICQHCANRICSQCSSPVAIPVGADILKDDGQITHIPILPIGTQGCVNKNCPK